jgi:hypothetical protein
MPSGKATTQIMKLFNVLFAGFTYPCGGGSRLLARCFTQVVLKRNGYADHRH